MTDLDTGSGSTGRRFLSRVRLGHVVMVLAALFAFVLNLAVLRGDDATVDVAVAASDLRPGTALSHGHIERIPAPTDELLTVRFVTADEIEDAVGKLTVRPITAGQPILLSDLLAVDTIDGLRAMSVPIEPSRAVAGQLRPGDLVDVVLVTDGVATYVATALEVLAVPSSDTNALGARSGYSPTLAVDATQALRIAAALDTGEVHVIRSTGAGSPELTQLSALEDQADEAVE